MSKKSLIIIFSVILVPVLVVLAVVLLNMYRVTSISNFAECAAAGYPILDSYPEQCMTPDGRTFRKELDTGVEVTYEGEMVCLPHKDTEGPVTLECAYGLQTIDGYYHALQSEDQLPFSFSIGDRVEVSGVIVANPSEVYDIVDTIQVEAITGLD